MNYYCNSFEPLEHRDLPIAMTRPRLWVESKFDESVIQTRTNKSMIAINWTTGDKSRNKFALFSWTFPTLHWHKQQRQQQRVSIEYQVLIENEPQRNGKLITSLKARETFNLVSLIMWTLSVAFVINICVMFCGSN